MPEIPEGAKKPQDHKTKSKKPKKSKSNVFTFEFRGETYPIDTDVRDDWELAEAFSDNRIPEALRMLLGTRQYEQVKKNLADKSGRTKATDMSEFASKLFEELSDLKD